MADAPPDPAPEEPHRPPSRPIPLPRPSRKTLREFLFQLVTITAGILIALGIDGVVESRRQRALVREAHAAIVREIADNLRELEGSLPSLDAYRRHLEDAQRFATDIIKTGKTDIRGLHFGVNLPSLNRASWQTAERTGALGHMDYADVRKYSELYELQQYVVDNQRDIIRGVSGVSAIGAMGEGGDPTRARPQDLETFRARVVEAMAAVTIHRDLARQLAEAYKRTQAR